MELLIRRAKADQRGVTTVTSVDRAEQGSRLCLVEFFESYVHTILKGPKCHAGCIRQKAGCRADTCPHCPWLFPRITVRGVEFQVPTADRLFRKRMKAACVRLEAAKVLEEGATSNFSVISLRRGGNSVAAARGVRDKVRNNHGRWGLAGAVARGQTSEHEYNSVLGRDDGAVLKALHADLNSQPQKKVRRS